MRARAICLSAIALLSINCPAWGQFETPPTIVISDIEREVYVSATADSEYSESRELWTQDGVFLDYVDVLQNGELGSAAGASADQETRVSSFSIAGDGSVLSATELGSGQDATVRGYSISRTVISFTVPVDAEYTLSGTLEADGEGDGLCLSQASVSMVGFEPGFIPFNHGQSIDCSSPPENGTFSFSGTIAANLPVGLSVEVFADPRSDQPGFSYPGDGWGSFEFRLDFGDRDDDGLLDDWEENGIDFPGEGIEIDLRAWGADPDHKDLFVEVDVVTELPSGGRAPEAALGVEGAFSIVANHWVGNPDGMAGVNLHLILDPDKGSDQVPHDEVPQGELSGTVQEIWSQFNTVKRQYLGSASDREHDWKNEILQAREHIFRYCLWANTLTVDTGEPMGRPFLGLAELPGNDLIVAAGRIITSYPGPLQLAALQGTLMHELGHTLGLDHGGQDDLNFKPNYLSVMNYAYSTPFEVTTKEGTRVAELWELDYSYGTLRKGKSILNEAELWEGEGSWGPRNRKMWFNSSPVAGSVQRTVSWAHSVPVDWNNNGTLDEDPLVIDLTRLDDLEPVEWDAELRPYSDWDRLRYHLSGAPNFDDAIDADLRTTAKEIDLETLEAFVDVPWTDQTAGDGRIFADDFEIGSTTTWSATVD